MAGPSSTGDAAVILAARDAGRRQTPAARATLLLSLAGGAHGDPLDLPIGARDSVLIDLREHWFGTRFDCLADCAICGETIEIAFDAAQVRDVAAIAGTIVDCETEGRRWRARVPTTRDLMVAAATADPVRARAILLERCLIDTVDTPSEDAAHAIANALAAADPQADALFDTTCPACGTSTTLPFDIAAHLWIEIDRWAEEVLDDVHALASSYGWSEADILALPASRRRAYLDRAGRSAGSIQ